jgi:hypothetical protein
MLIAALLWLHVGLANAQSGAELYTSSFALSGISEIEVHHGMQVTVTQSDHQRVRATGTRAMLAEIDARVENSRLILASKTREPLPVAFEISVSQLEELLLDDVRVAEIGQFTTESLNFLVSGAGQFNLSEVRAQTLSVTLDGAGKITGDAWIAEQLSVRVAGSGAVDVKRVEAQSLESSISGSAQVRLANQGLLESANVHLAGTGIFNAGELLTREAVIAIAGSANALVNVEELLDVNTAGSGIVTYIGTPIIKAGIFGSGLVQQAFE